MSYCLCNLSTLASSQCLLSWCVFLTRSRSQKETEVGPRTFAPYAAKKKGYQATRKKNAGKVVTYKVRWNATAEISWSYSLKYTTVGNFSDTLYNDINRKLKVLYGAEGHSLVTTHCRAVRWEWLLTVTQVLFAIGLEIRRQWTEVEECKGDANAAVGQFSLKQEGEHAALAGPCSPSVALI